MKKTQANYNESISSPYIIASLSDGAIAGIVTGTVVGALALAGVAGLGFWAFLRIFRGAETAIPKPDVFAQASGQTMIPLGMGNNAFGVQPNLSAYDQTFQVSVKNNYFTDPSAMSILKYDVSKLMHVQDQSSYNH